MLFDRTLMWSSVATRHLLESRLHMLAAVEAMADIEGFLPEYEKAVSLRATLDEVFIAVEDKTIELCGKLKENDGSPGRN